jgi:hypothetical protein
MYSLQIIFFQIVSEKSIPPVQFIIGLTGGNVLGHHNPSLCDGWA